MVITQIKNVFIATVCLWPYLCSFWLLSCAWAGDSRARFDGRALDDNFNGWERLVNRLHADGLSTAKLKEVYLDARMPAVGDIPFRVRPIETAQMYTDFFAPDKIELSKQFIDQHSIVFNHSQSLFGVNRSVVAAILLIETHFGRSTGSELVINRLSRVASLASPENISWNYQRLKNMDSKTELKDVTARAQHLEQVFYPEVPALFQIADQTGIDLLKLKGSVSGAFGMPQFLPTTYLRYGVDCDNDGKVDLFNPDDAICSTAHFLAAQGWQDSLTEPQKREILWHYNHSEAYVDTVLKIAKRLQLLG